MGWVLSMAVVQGLSAEEIAGRLEAELGEKTTGDSDSGRVVLFQLSERINCGFFQVGCWVHGAMAWQITHCREEPETEEYQILGVPPGIFAQQAQADAAGEDTCSLGAPVVEMFVSLTGIHYDRDG
jgi:hypothetical protein